MVVSNGQHGPAGRKTRPSRGWGRLHAIISRFADEFQQTEDGQLDRRFPTKNGRLRSFRIDGPRSLPKMANLTEDAQRKVAAFVQHRGPSFRIGARPKIHLNFLAAWRASARGSPEVSSTAGCRLGRPPVYRPIFLSRSYYSAAQLIAKLNDSDGEDAGKEHPDQ